MLGVGHLDVSPPVKELGHDGQVVELGGQVEGGLLQITTATAHLEKGAGQGVWS